MIAQLTLENLKGFATRTVLDLAPLTLLYGENSAGKSTILQALRLLREINNDSAPQGVRSIPFRDLVTNSNTDLLLSLGFEYAFEPNVSDMWNLRWLSTIGWDKVAQQPRLYSIQAFQLRKSVYPVFHFAYDGTMLVKDCVLPSQPNGLNDLCTNLVSHLDEIRQGVERLIEARVLQNFLETHAKEAMELYDAICAMVRQSNKEINQAPHINTLRDPGDYYEEKQADSVFDDIDVIFPPGYKNIFVEQAAEEDAIIETKKSNARSLLTKWRGESPEWIVVSPPGWVEFKNTDEYAHETQALRTTIFSDIINFCDNPERVDLTATLIHCELSSPPTQDLNIREGLLHHLRDALSNPRIFIDLVPSKGGSPLSVQIERRTECFMEFWKAFDAIIEQTKEEWAGHYQMSRQGLKSIKHVPPLREPPQRIYAREAGNRSAAMELARNSALVVDVNVWLARIGMDYVVKIHDLAPGSGYFQVLLSDRRRPEVPAVNYADTGFGVSQLLPILVAGLTGQRQTILVEQPELHIHPRLQAELGSFFAECIKERGHQFIVETHSEHIMLRVQRLIRNGMPASDNLAVQYVRRTPSGSTVERLVVNGSGEFVEGWPEGFMPDRLKELL